MITKEERKQMGKINAYKQARKSGNKYFHNTEVKVPYKIKYTFPENIKYAKQQQDK